MRNLSLGINSLQLNNGTRSLHTQSVVHVKTITLELFARVMKEAEAAKKDCNIICIPLEHRPVY